VNGLQSLGIVSLSVNFADGKERSHRVARSAVFPRPVVEF